MEKGLGGIQKRLFFPPNAASIRKADGRLVQLLINLTCSHCRVSKNAVERRFEAVAVFRCFVQRFLPVSHALIPKERVHVRQARASVLS